MGPTTEGLTQRSGIESQSKQQKTVELVGLSSYTVSPIIAPRVPLFEMALVDAPHADVADAELFESAVRAGICNSGVFKMSSRCLRSCCSTSMELHVSARVPKPSPRAHPAGWYDPEGTYRQWCLPREEGQQWQWMQSLPGPPRTGSNLQRTLGHVTLRPGHVGHRTAFNFRYMTMPQRTVGGISQVIDFACLAKLGALRWHRWTLRGSRPPLPKAASAQP